jgi:trehalose 6-phosphate synthase/phosphatase
MMIAIGDDYTDEDIFKSLPEDAITVKVGSNISAASYFLHNYKEVRRLLSSLVKAGEQSRTLKDDIRA